MTLQEVHKILSGEDILTTFDENGNLIRLKTYFHADVFPYKYTALMFFEGKEPQFEEDFISVDFLYDCSKGFLDDADYYPNLDTDSHYHHQLVSICNGWLQAKSTNTTTYKKIISQKEKDMLYNPDSEKHLSVYACHPDGTVDTIHFDKIHFTYLDGMIYFLALNENKDTLPFGVYRDADDNSINFIDPTSVDVGEVIISKLMRTHIVGNEENFRKLLDDNFPYHMRMYEDGEFVEYKRSYVAEYNGKYYIYFSKVKNEYMCLFEIEKTLGQWRVVRVDDDALSSKVFWNHPFHWKIADEYQLLHNDGYTLTRKSGNEEETFYVVGNVIYLGNRYVAISPQMKENEAGEVYVNIYELVRKRGETWLCPVENEDLRKDIIDIFNEE